MRNTITHSKPSIGKGEIRAVTNVLKSRQLSQARIVSEFEKQFARYLKVKGALALNSGTSALHLCLLALDIKESDEVILPTYVCTAVLNAILYTGACPKFADINEEDFNISLKDTQRKLSPKTKAIVLPHMFGLPIQNILAFKNLGPAIIEDCAQAIGAKHLGKNVGSFADLSMASFYATKIITTGEGGMVFSNNLRLLDKIRDLRDYDNKDYFKRRFNYKMTDIQAALGISQLKMLDRFIARRKHLAAKYNRAFSDCDFVFPKPSKEHIYFRYVIKIKKDVKEALRLLEKNKIICQRPVYKPLHKYLGMNGYLYAEDAWDRAISIPIYPSLKDTEQKRVIEIIKKVCYN